MSEETTEKKTLAQKLHARQLGLPNPVLYWILMWVVKVLNLIDKTEFVYKAYPAKEDGPIVMIANHSSRVEYQFTGIPCYPKRLNYVVGYNEFFRFPLSLVLKYVNAVPKMNFTPDFYCARQILRLTKMGANICIMPEGMSSITGMAQPVMIGSGKLIKMIGNPVYYSKIQGAYLSYPKHILDSRKGKVVVVVDRMFTKEELKAMTPEEIEARMNRMLAHDDYMWNSEMQISYKGEGGMAKDLETLLYMCPRCGKIHEMESDGNTLRCKACGNSVEIDDKYNIKAVGDSVCPPLVSDWTIAERKWAAEEVRKENFRYEGKVKIGMLPKYKYLKHEDTSEIVGEGTLSLDKEGLHFRGTARGSEYNFDLLSSEVPTFGMCTNISRFYTFNKGEFIEFFPENNDTLIWDHLAEELHRANGGKWQNTEYRDYEHECRN